MGNFNFSVLLYQTRSVLFGVSWNHSLVFSFLIHNIRDDKTVYSNPNSRNVSAMHVRYKNLRPFTNTRVYEILLCRPYLCLSQQNVRAAHLSAMLRQLIKSNCARQEDFLMLSVSSRFGWRIGSIIFVKYLSFFNRC